MSKKIENQVTFILNKFEINQVPVPVEKIALKLDLAVMPTDLGPGISGALIIKDGKATIGVNQNESRVRRRFTIAHELGHFLMHNTVNNLFVEKLVLFRDQESSSGEKRREREANAFAASILMPESILEQEVREASQDDSLNDEELIGILAKKFDVSDVAMTYRLSNLGII
jgi:Zn-dependent peptidase ImmA (M78 family)